MSLRFRRSIKLMPGVRINMGLRGASLSVGKRGASLNIGKNGLYGNVGLPGSGLSVRSKLSGSNFEESISDEPAPPGKISVYVNMTVSDDGEVSFSDASGNPIPEKWIKKLREQNGSSLAQKLENICSKRNEILNKALAFHLNTPSPNDHLKYEKQEFTGRLH